MAHAPPTHHHHPANAISRADRVAAAVTAAACLALILIAASLAPSPEGHGTHEALGLPACGFAATFDLPCFTCGMTTAFSHAARAQFVAAAKTQPMGALLAVLAASMVWTGSYAAITASPVWNNLGKFLVSRGLYVLLALLVAAWVYKITVW